MDWFERITGFREGDEAAIRAQLSVAGQTLVSLANGSRHGIGQLTLPSLRELRARVAGGDTAAGPRSKVSNRVGDARALHREPEFEGALFQVASQFNLLEMTGPDVKPGDGVTRYAHDRTQGPACAMAAGAATIYRNYFAPVAVAGTGTGTDVGATVVGQTRGPQLDALAPLGAALSRALGRPVPWLWEMRNGYALCRAEGLDAIGALLREADEPLKESLRGELCIGLHADVEVTDAEPRPGPKVSQAFCSALPVAYTAVPRARWAPFAQLVLEAAYEATLLAARDQQHRGVGSGTVLLTRLGGGVFGNDDAWIDAAIERALHRVAGLDVRLVHYGAVPRSMQELVRRLA